MKTLQPIRSNIFTILIAFFVGFSLLPTFYELSRAGEVRPERSFELVHNYYTDYNFYLSRIRQGLDGHVLVREKYTSEPHPGSLIHVMYTLMGYTGKLVRVPYWEAGSVYHAARIVLAVALLAVIAEYCRRSFLTVGDRAGKGVVEDRKLKVEHVPSLSVIAFLLAVTASGWPKLVYVEGMARFGGYMAWWSVVDSLQRITFIPHLLAGQTLMVFLMMALAREEAVRRPINQIFLGLMGLLLGFVFPPGLVFVYAYLGVVGAVAVIGGIREIGEMRVRKRLITLIRAWGAVFMISMPSLAYLILMTGIYPWKRLAELDILHPLPFVYSEYFLALGPMLPLGVAGLCIAQWKKERLMLPAAAWVLAWGALLGIFNFVPQQSPLRFSEMLPNVPLGILTAYLGWVAWKKIREVREIRGIGGMVPAALTLLVLLGLGQMYSSWLWQKDFVDHKMRAAYPLVPTGAYVMYPLKDLMGAMFFIKDHTDPSEVVLSEVTAGNYIPVISGNTVYIGHDNTVNAEAKKIRVKRFYSGVMTKNEAEEFIRNNRIAAVFFGPSEKELNGSKDLTTYYPFLTEGYRNGYVTVYMVNLPYGDIGK